MKPFCRVAFLLLTFTEVLLRISYAQTPIANLTLPGNAAEIRGMPIAEDIFLSAVFSSATTSRSVQSYFIHPNGKRTELDFKVIGDKPMIGGVRRGNNTFFYYVDEISKQAYISCLLVDSIGATRALSERIEIPGKIYGTYIEDGDLFALCALKNEFKLRLLHIHDGVMINEISFAISFDIGNNKKENVSFFDASIPTTPQEASALVKLIKDKNSIWLVADEPIGRYDSFEQHPSTIFRTTVVRLDLQQKTSSIRTFFETSKSTFTSAILDGDLYRLVLEKELRVDQFNFESGKKIKTIKLQRGNEPGRDSTYARIGKYNKTEKDVKNADVVKRILGTFIIVDSLPGQKRLLTIGDYGDQMITFTGITNVLSIAVSATSLLISDLSEGEYSCMYFYYVSSSGNDFTATYKTPLLRQVIDDYEYRLLKEKVRFDYRGYLHQPTFSYAFYQRNKSNVLEIVKFEK
jgi:hypothetical protein